jgi:predicted ArsR family transcriptional regulator
MTDKEMQKLSDMIAEKVVKQLEEKQQEWDSQFHYDVQDFVTDSTYTVKFAETKDILEQDLQEAVNNLNKALEDEDYMSAEKISKIIKNIKQKLLNL